MGARGPAPKPAALRAVRGDRADRFRLPPVPASEEVKPPAGLSRDARAVWRRLAPDLVKSGVLTAWDTHAFGICCTAIARHWRASRMLEEEGEMVEAPVFDRNGRRTGERLVRNPWGLVLKEAADTTQRLAARFGLTPTDRAQLDMHPEHEESDAERLLTPASETPRRRGRR